MKKNKGFTLIELLAVLVILAIIALVITPIVTGLIKDAQQKAAEDAMNGLVDAAEIYYGRQAMKYNGKFNGNNTLTIKFATGVATPQSPTAIDSNIKFEYDGYKVDSGTITITRAGVITGTDIKINGYKCQYASSVVSCAESN